MTDGLSRKPPGRAHRRPFKEGGAGYSAGAERLRQRGERRRQCIDRARSRALIRKAVELAPLGTSTVRRDFAADFAADLLQMQPSRIADTILDCSLEVERMGRDFRLMSAIVAETGAPSASGARSASARRRPGRGG